MPVCGLEGNPSVHGTHPKITPVSSSPGNTPELALATTELRTQFINPWECVLPNKDNRQILLSFLSFFSALSPNMGNTGNPVFTINKSTFTQGLIWSSHTPRSKFYVPS